MNYEILFFCSSPWKKSSQTQTTENKQQRTFSTSHMTSIFITREKCFYHSWKMHLSLVKIWFFTCENFKHHQRCFIIYHLTLVKNTHQRQKLWTTNYELWTKCLTLTLRVELRLRSEKRRKLPFHLVFSRFCRTFAAWFYFEFWI